MGVKGWARWILLLACLQAAWPVQRAEASGNESKVFLVTTSYGVMAGTLTGLASLAFYESPGDHLRNIAKGASLGLYAGILLGAYMLYGLPDPNKPASSRRSEPQSFDLDSRLDRSPHPYVVVGQEGALQGGVWLRF